MISILTNSIGSFTKMGKLNAHFWALL